MKSASLSLVIRICLIATVFLSATIATRIASASEVVRFKADFSPGTVVIKTSERRLYYVLGDGTAVRYPVGVGRAGQTWKGSATITGKYIKPGWRPPEVIKRAQPNLPDLIPGGSPENPRPWFTTNHVSPTWWMPVQSRRGSFVWVMMGTPPGRQTWPPCV